MQDIPQDEMVTPVCSRIAVPDSQGSWLILELAELCRQYGIAQAGVESRWVHPWTELTFRLPRMPRGAYNAITGRFRRRVDCALAFAG